MSQQVQVQDGKLVFTGTGSSKSKSNPDFKGNTAKGTRVCAQCGITEAETLRENDKYTFVSIDVTPTDFAQKNGTVGKNLMGCVHCYGKNRAKKPRTLTIQQIDEQIAQLRTYRQMILDAQKNGSK